MKFRQLLHVVIVCSLSVLACSGDEASENWPQAAGPNHDWTVKTDRPVPLKWSAENNQNIRWRISLPESGQSGIAIWEDRIFLTTMMPLEVGAAEKKGADIVLYCISAIDGGILWQHDLAGNSEAASLYGYGFSSSSSPTPITDGEHVWFWNASGQMGCWSIDGEEVWTRSWTPTLGRPFNKQYEPIKYGNTIVNVEPRDLDDPLRRDDAWNYLRGFDSTSGAALWIAPDGLTHYNTPMLGILPGGGKGILSARGAHHDVPETPAGLTMTRVDGPDAGKTIWQWDSEPEGKALVTQNWDRKYAYWLDETRTDLVVLNTADGTEAKRISWNENVSVTSYDESTRSFSTRSGVNLENEEPAVTVFPAWHTNINLYPYVYFSCFNFQGKRKANVLNIGPRNSLARINIETEAVEYLEVPFPMPSVEGETTKNTDRFFPGMTTNGRGIDVAEDRRSGRSGWWWCFNGNTIVVNQYLYFTFMCGRVQVIDGTTEKFNETALISLNDLGEFGKTWSVNTPSYSNGCLYHRTMKELLCIKTSE